MKRNRASKYLLTTACCIVLALGGHAAAFNKQSNLHLIKRIYVGVIQNTVESRKIEPFLKTELEKRGFTIVESVEAADAILLGEIMADIVLDGDGSTPHKAIYRYRLAVPSKEVVWEAKVKFTTVLDFAQDNERAARKIAKKLSSDWQKSAKAAARNQRTMPNKALQLAAR